MFTADDTRIRETHRRARERGHALLVLVLPEERAPRLERIELWSRVLRDASDVTLAELAPLELVGASLSRMRRGLPRGLALPSHAVAALLLEPDSDGFAILPCAALELDPLVELLARTGPARSSLRSRQIGQALGRLARGAPGTIERRARFERGALMPADLHRLETARIVRRAPPLDLVARNPARVRRKAQDLEGETWTEALAKVTRGAALPPMRCGLERFLPRCSRR